MPTANPSPEPSALPRARVVLLCGPSGSGKSHLAERSGLPTVCLDDFYRDGDDPALPRSELGIADWDHPDAWDAGGALASLTELALTASTWLPTYDIGQDRTTGTRHLDLGTSPVFVAEGIFAPYLIRSCRERGILADALCLTHRPTVTFWRRLVRDLREGRKSPWILVRRGIALKRREPAIVAQHVALGAAPVNSDDALRRLQRIAAEQLAARDDGIAA